MWIKFILILGLVFFFAIIGAANDSLNLDNNQSNIESESTTQHRTTKVKWGEIKVGVLITVALAVLLWASFSGSGDAIKAKKYEIKMSKSKIRFVNTIAKGLANDNIEGLEEIKNIFDAYLEDAGAYKHNMGTLTLWLSELQSRISEDSLNNLHSNENDALKLKMSLITEFIQQARELEPYKDLSERSYNIVTDLSDFIKNKDYEASKRKLIEIAAFISGHEETINSLNIRNRKSYITSLVGVIVGVSGIFAAIIF